MKSRRHESQVCSFYMCAPMAFSELYATEGLNPQAVHLAQPSPVRVWDGTIAAKRPSVTDPMRRAIRRFFICRNGKRPIIPSSAFRPSLCTLSVLVVQNKTKRAYREDEVNT